MLLKFKREFTDNGIITFRQGDVILVLGPNKHESFRYDVFQTNGHRKVILGSMIDKPYWFNVFFDRLDDD